VGTNLILWLIIGAVAASVFNMIEKKQPDPAILASACEAMPLVGSTFVFDYEAMNSGSEIVDLAINNDLLGLNTIVYLSKPGLTHILAAVIPSRGNVTVKAPRGSFSVEIHTGNGFCSISRGFLNQVARINVRQPLDLSQKANPSLTISPDVSNKIQLSFDDLQPESNLVSTQQSGIDLKLQAAKDGHFYIAGEGNGFPVVFLVDTGATNLAFPARMLQNMDVKHCRKTTSNTANGVANGCVATLNRVKVGPYQIDNVQAIFLPELHAPLLGMNVLNQFSMYHLGDTLEMSPR